ncbi:MAG: hypothetical protein COA46_07590 [Porticoccaceae bacterium]|nr:MAG: hypothetical protein COA46_07590 [Porticoccaceae bacterium]
MLGAKSMKSNNYERNVKVLEALQDAGSNVDKEHNIEHHFYCVSEESYQKLLELGRSAGYKIMFEGSADYGDGKMWQLDLVKSVKPSIDVLEAQTLELEAFAEKTESDYDGWGTEVEV